MLLESISHCATVAIASGATSICVWLEALKLSPLDQRAQIISGVAQQM